MAWTYFTGDLAAGDELTAAMVAELVAALDERLKAINAGWGVSTDVAQVALADSRLGSQKVVVTGAGFTDQTVTFHQIIHALSVSYLRPLFIEAGTGFSGLYAGAGVSVEALADLGAPGTYSDWAGTDLSTATYWNMVRRALMLLRWVPLYAGGVSARYTKAVTSNDVGASGLSPVIAGYAAFSEVSGGGSQLAMMRIQAIRGTGGTYDPSYLIDGYRAVSSGITISPATPWATWQPAYRPRWELPSSSTEYAAQPAEVLISGTAYLITESAIADLADWEIAETASTATGATSISYRMLGYDDGSQFDELDADLAWVGSGTEFKSGGTSLTGLDLAGRPTFVYV